MKWRNIDLNLFRQFESKLNETVTKIAQKQNTQNNDSSKKQTHNALQAELFGSDNDSDWSDLEGKSCNDWSVFNLV